MSSGGHLQKLSDADVREILMIPAHVRDQDIAAERGVHPNTIRSIRKRESRRAMRIANELGLLGLPEIKGAEPEKDSAAYVVQGCVPKPVQPSMFGGE